jgi:hypothetical protein
LLVFAFAIGCGDGGTTTTNNPADAAFIATDSGLSVDSGISGTMDAGAVDSPAADTPAADTGVVDSSVTDIGPPDSPVAADAGAVTGGAVGNACASSADCAAPATTCVTSFGSLTYAGGYCTRNCASDVECGAGAVCPSFAIGMPKDPRYCVRRCEQDSDCRRDSAAYVCLSLEPPPTVRGLCVPRLP